VLLEKKKIRNTLMAFADDSSLGNVPILHWGHHVIQMYNAKRLKESGEIEIKRQD